MSNFVMPKLKQKPRLFLCHSSKDKKFVRQLATDLNELDVLVWLDEWELQVGDSLHGCIGTAIDKSANIAVILSPNSIKSKWCQKELQAALAKEDRAKKNIVIPILVRKVKLPIFLADKIYLDFRESTFESLTKLAGIMHGLNTREIVEQIAKKKPLKIADSKNILKKAGWSGEWTYIESDDYEILRKIIKKTGVNIESDEFDIIPRTKKGALKNRIRMKK